MKIVQDKRAFVRGILTGAAILALWASGVAAEVPTFARGAEEMGPILTNAEIRANPKLKGRKASYFCDDAIWFLRDLARQRPKSMFDHPFLGVLKECHEKYGLKMQLNLFYRTDFFYGMDEFSLAEVPDAYRDEWQENRDWLKLGFHSLQEFPDYPWVNARYDDVKKLFGMVHEQVKRFAGDGVFTTALVPHWGPMSREGCRALYDCGIRLMEASNGPRYRYDGKRERLPYGHDMRLLQNRHPEVGFFWRDNKDEAILSSLCSYNHISSEQWDQTRNTFKVVYDHETGLCFKHMFGDAPVLNLVDATTLKEDIAKVLGAEHLVFSCHEQYFFSDYLAYQPEYAEKIRIMSKSMRDNGYGFILLEELIP